MNQPNHKLILAGAVFLAAPWMACYAMPQTTPADSPTTKADNTATNKGDADAGHTTADQQKMNKTDRNLTKRIRRSIMEDKSLSTYAHNVKIVSQNGAVTLKGPVRSEEEKTAIVAKAQQVAGSGNVTDNLSIAPKGSDTP
ncbi:MAG: BON domain-containing protein [Bryobacteraceae bacterium]